jgi:UDP-N-acetylmuramate-alanine ligase
VLNNLEYDHADIFPDIGAIETQFHHLVRTVPGVGRLVVNGDEASLGACSSAAAGARRKASAARRRQLDHGRAPGRQLRRAVQRRQWSAPSTGN